MSAAQKTLREQLQSAFNESEENNNDDNQDEAQVGSNQNDKGASEADTDAAKKGGDSDKSQGSKDDKTETDKSGDSKASKADDKPGANDKKSDKDNQSAGKSADKGDGDKLKAPEHWTNSDKELFDSLPDKKYQQWFLDRHKSMEADYTKKRQSDTEQFQSYRQIDQALAPLQPYIQAQGMSSPQMVATWAQWHQSMLQNPAGTLIALGKQFNVDLGMSEAGDQQASPEIQNLTNTVQELQTNFNNYQTTINNDRQAQETAKLESFRVEKDGQGNLLRPYFDEVMTEMTHLATFAKQQGQPIDLQQLYDQAVRMSPAVSEKYFASQREAEAQKQKEMEAQRLKEEQERVQKAEQASASVSSSNTTGSADTPTQNTLSLREELQKNIKAGQPARI